MKQNGIKTRSYKKYTITSVGLLLIAIIAITGLLRGQDMLDSRSIDFTYYKSTDLGAYLTNVTAYSSPPEKAFTDAYPGTWQITTFYDGDMTSGSFNPKKENPIFEINQHRVGSISLIDETCGPDKNTPNCRVIGKNAEGGDITVLNYDDAEVQGLEAFYGTDIKNTRINIYAGSGTLTSAQVVELYNSLKPSNKYLIDYKTRTYIQ